LLGGREGIEKMLFSFQGRVRGKAPPPLYPPLLKTLLRFFLIQELLLFSIISITLSLRLFSLALNRYRTPVHSSDLSISSTSDT